MTPSPKLSRQTGSKWDSPKMANRMIGTNAETTYPKSMTKLVTMMNKKPRRPGITSSALSPAATLEQGYSPLRAKS